MRSLYWFCLMALFLGCSTEEKETTTTGNLHVFIPESLAPVLKDEVNEFLSLYQAHGARLTESIVPAETVARRFVQDTGRIAFLFRPLTQMEKDQVKEISGMNDLIVAYDGIAAVVNPKNKNAEMTTTAVQKILSGTMTRWEQTGGTMTGSIKVYCQDSSDVMEYLRQRFAMHTGVRATYIRTPSDLQTIRCTEKDPDALGFVALGWLDSAMSTVKILNLGRTVEDTDTSFAGPAETMGKFYSPHPANIYRNYYPLKRAIYMYTKGRMNLAVGFGVFVATPEGQKLFLKYGLLPGTQRIRLKADQPS